MRAPHSLAEVLSRGEEGQEAHDRQSLASAEAPDRAAAGGLAGRGSAAGRSWVGGRPLAAPGACGRDAPDDGTPGYTGADRQQGLPRAGPRARHDRSAVGIAPAPCASVSVSSVPRM